MIINKGNPPAILGGYKFWIILQSKKRISKFMNKMFGRKYLTPFFCILLSIIFYYTFFYHNLLDALLEFEFNFKNICNIILYIISILYLLNMFYKYYFELKRLLVSSILYILIPFCINGGFHSIETSNLTFLPKVLPTFLGLYLSYLLYFTNRL